MTPSYVTVHGCLCLSRPTLERRLDLADGTVPTEIARGIQTPVYSAQFQVEAQHSVRHGLMLVSADRFSCARLTNEAHILELTKASREALWTGNSAIPRHPHALRGPLFVLIPIGAFA